MHFVRQSVRSSVRPSVCNNSCPQYNLRKHQSNTIRLGTNVVLIEMKCSDFDPDQYLKGQGHTRNLKVRVHMLVSAL